jgi:ferredoxin
MKLKVDKTLCTGCEVCTTICPDVFEMDDDDGLAKVKDDADYSNCVGSEAIENCPVDAISEA